VISDRLYYEFKLGWVNIILTPLLILVGTILFAIGFMAFHKNTTLLLLLELEVLFPLVAGVAVGSLIAQEPALELQLTMLSKYSMTSLLRILLVFVWIGFLAWLSITCSFAFKLIDLPEFTRSWPPILLYAMLQLLWFAPLAWFISIAFCLAQLTNSRTASGAILGAFWLIDILSSGVIIETFWLKPLLLFPTSFFIYPYVTTSSITLYITYWFTTRWEVLATAVVLFPLGWLLLRNTERLLQGITEE
jgi:hypothetical protein